MNSKKIAEQRALLYSLLGDLPERDTPVYATKKTQTVYDSYVLEELVLHINCDESIPAYLARPKNTTEPIPAVLYNHLHGGNYNLGKQELITGYNCLQPPPYAEVLTGMGYAVLCIDALGFGARAGKTESQIFKEMLWNGQVMWGMMIYDSLRAIDYLASRPDIDPTRISTMGMSMGSTMAWWLAALDTRIKVCVDICCLTDFEELVKDGNLDWHGIYYYVPGLLKHFTTAQINELIAPRPHLSLAGLNDPLTPSKGLDKIDAHLKAVYTIHNAFSAWKLFTSESGHQETAAMRKEIIAFLRHWL